MGIPVSQLQERISSEEFANYIVSEKIDPPIGERLDYLLTIVAQIILSFGNSKTHFGNKMVEWDKIEMEPEESEDLILKYFEGNK